MEIKNKNELYFSKVRENAIIPTKRDEDAGYDFYICFEKGKELTEIKPHETVMIPTGIATAFHKSKVLILKERGSIGSRGLAERCGVVDSNYRGEIFAAIQNNNDKPIHIYYEDIKEFDNAHIYLDGRKAICQGLVLDIPSMKEKEITFEELKNISSNRGDGKLGSSGK